MHARRRERKSLLPHMFKMARQFLGCPGSSAEAERLFSTAGRMHSDLCKQLKDTTIGISLEAGYNAK